MNAGLMAGLPNGITGAVRKAVGLIAGTPASIASLGTNGCVYMANAAAYAVGTVVANTPKRVLSIAGKGQLNWVAIADATAGVTDRVVITMDGSNVIRDVSMALNPAGQGFCALGGLMTGASGDNLIAFQPVLFDSSCSIDVYSNSATSSAILYVNGEIHA